MQECRERIQRLLTWCEERLRAYPDDVRSLMDISRALWDMGQKARALEYLQKILARHPGHPEVRETIQRYSAEVGAMTPLRVREGGRS